MKLQNGVHFVVRLIQEKLQLESFDLAHNRSDTVANLRSELFVSFFICQLSHHQCIVIILLQLGVLIYRTLYRIHLSNNSLGHFVVIPEVGSGHFLFKVLNHLLLEI